MHCWKLIGIRKNGDKSVTERGQKNSLSLVNISAQEKRKDREKKECKKKEEDQRNRGKEKKTYQPSFRYVWRIEMYCALGNARKRVIYSPMKVKNRNKKIKKNFADLNTVEIVIT